MVRAGGFRAFRLASIRHLICHRTCDETLRPQRNKRSGEEALGRVLATVRYVSTASSVTTSGFNRFCKTTHITPPTPVDTHLGV